VRRRPVRDGQAGGRSAGYRRGAQAQLHQARHDGRDARARGGPPPEQLIDLPHERPGPEKVGNVAGEAQALRARLAKEHSSSTPGASALTCAELRLLPLPSTHLPFPEIAAQMFLSRNTIKSEAYLIYRKLGATSRSQAVARSRNLSLLHTW
jgi:ATP/maltotriose-dependent transcriptional regulator MalT